MATAKKSTEVRQEEIAEAALAAVAAKGWGSVSIGDVATRIGLAPSALYRHYRSKDEILKSVLDLIGKRLTNSLREAEADCGRPLNCMRELLTRHAGMLAGNVGIRKVVFSQAVADNPVTRKQLREIVRAYLAQVARLVRRGQELGQIRSELDPDTVAMMFLGIVQPAVFRKHLGERSLDMVRHAERSWELLKSAIIAG